MHKLPLEAYRSGYLSRLVKWVRYFLDYGKKYGLERGCMCMWL